MQLSLNEISLLPYACVNGVWTVSDEMAAAVFEAMQADGTDKSVFYDGHFRTPEAFIQMLQMPSNTVVFAFKGATVIGFAWLNNIAQNRAFCHFCFLKHGWGRDAVTAGKMMLDYWLAFTDRDGEPLFDVLLGAVAATNTHALSYLAKLGTTRLGAIPKAIRDVYSGESVAGEILYFARQ